MIITKIEPQQRKPHRKSIYLNGEFAFGIHDEVLLKFGLRRGDHLTPEKVVEITTYEEFRSGREKALKLLSRKPRTERELRTKLLRTGYSEATCERVLAHLREARLIDDLDYARRYAHESMTRKPMGERMLKQRLRQKGIPEDAIQTVLREMFSSESEEFRYALELARKRIERHPDLSRHSLHKRSSDQWQEEQTGVSQHKKRIADYLVRRGFDWDTVHRVLEEIFNARPIQNQ
ncbi:MAG: regulatory protein RecX [Bacteroidota bacterium]